MKRKEVAVQELVIERSLLDEVVAATEAIKKAKNPPCMRKARRELLKATLRANPNKVYMYAWYGDRYFPSVVREVNPAYHKSKAATLLQGECGTTACVAGWCGALFGEEPGVWSKSQRLNLSPTYLNLDAIADLMGFVKFKEEERNANEEGSPLFYPGLWPAEDASRLLAAVHAENFEKATEIVCEMIDKYTDVEC